MLMDRQTDGQTSPIYKLLEQSGQKVQILKLLNTKKMHLKFTMQKKVMSKFSKIKQTHLGSKKYSGFVFNKQTNNAIFSAKIEICII